MSTVLRSSKGGLDGYRWKRPRVRSWPIASRFRDAACQKGACSIAMIWRRSGMRDWKCSPLLGSIRTILVKMMSRWRLRRGRSEEHTSELQSLMRISYAVFCLKKKNKQQHKLCEYRLKPAITNI